MEHTGKPVVGPSGRGIGRVLRATRSALTLLTDEGHEITIRSDTVWHTSQHVVTLICESHALHRYRLDAPEHHAPASNASV